MDKEVGRRKGIYLRAIAGIRKGLIQNKRICFLTLTTSDSTGDGLCDKDKMDLINANWHVLLAFIEKKYNVKLEFLNVTTNEGNGVIHLLVCGLPFIYWLSLVRWWNYYHGSQLVSISRFNGNDVEMANYLMSQYLSNQRCVFRFKMSNNFVCKRFMYYWKLIKDCSRGNVKSWNKWMGCEYYMVDKVRLKENFLRWIKFYVFTGKCMSWIPNDRDFNSVLMVT